MGLSHEMLNLARQQAPDGRFFQGDMRDFQMSEKVDAIIIPARSVSYLLENKDVEAALATFHDHLSEGGKLIFDFIDAHTYFLKMDWGHMLSRPLFLWPKKTFQTIESKIQVKSFLCRATHFLQSPSNTLFKPTCSNTAIRNL